MLKLFNDLNNLATGIAPVFYKLLVMSLTAACIGVIILLIRRIADKKIPPVWKYILWGLVLVALVIPYRPQSNFSLVQNPQPLEELSYREAYDKADSQAKLFLQQENTEPTQAQELKEKANTLFLKSLTFDITLPLLWLFGVMGAVLFLFIGRLSLSRRIRAHTIPDKRYDSLLFELKAKLGITSDIQVIVQDCIASPALLGLFKPKILLPQYTQEMSEQTVSYILMHELAHFKRKDMLLNYLLLLLQAIYWFNPLIWILFKFIREDMELLNDAYLLKIVGNESGKAYARSLVEVLGYSHNISFVPKLLCMVDGKKNVERRIGMMKLGETFRKHKAIICTACLLVICAVSVLFLTQGNDKRDTLKWANNLNVSDVSRIELVVSPGSGDDAYREFEKEEYQNIVALLNKCGGRYLASPEALSGKGITFYITTKDGMIHTVSNQANTYLNIDGDTYDADNNWLSGWGYQQGNAPVPGDFHYGGKLSAFKGLELYVWKDTQGVTQYTLLQGTNRNKEENEIYNSASATDDIKEIGATLSMYKEGLSLFIMQMKEQDFTKEEMNTLKTLLMAYIHPNSTVSIGLFKPTPKPTDGSRQLTQEEIEQVNAAFEPLLPSNDPKFEYEINPICHFFTSYYEKPEDINLEAFTRYFPGEVLKADNAEDAKQFEALKQLDDFPFKSAGALSEIPVPVQRKPVKSIDDVLQTYMGVSVKDLNDTDGTLYLDKPYESFYTYTSDAGFGTFSCTGGEIDGDVVRLFSEHATLTLQRQNGAYHIISLTET